MPPSDPTPPKLTDLEILEAIYDRVYEEFVSTRAGETNFVEMDLDAIASGLDMDKHLLFGRLMHDLANRYEYKQEGRRAPTRLFFSRSGAENPSVHVPYLSSVVADLTEKQKKYDWSLGISITSVGIALGSAVVSLFALLSGGA